MVDFKKLKAKRRTASDLAEKLNKMQTNYQTDERYWYPKLNKEGNGYAEIRFLPAPEDEDNEFIKAWDHAFKGPTGLWYIERSLTSIGKKDPVSDLNSKDWNAGREDIARKRKRRLYFVANIYVVKDPATPENEGKIFLYRFGQKIMDKLDGLLKPAEGSSDEPVNPFDLWEGATLKLKIKTIREKNGTYPNYDDSQFGNPGPLFKSDKELEAAFADQNLYSLVAEIDPKHYKTYEELKKRLDEVLDIKSTDDDAPVRRTKPVIHKEEDTSNEDTSDTETVEEEEEIPTKSSSSDEDEDEINFIKNLRERAAKKAQSRS